ncbi:hypothetical protein Pcinc_008485 [Petrolisthes cinctipes]|uniref:Uncharacterized protein n=1 Tax=Petrolisthes cinctipes TaxID=88211 RepID=A0AAE1G720_PETCI|nr:hypothetical protein Pcinc_008485 [Petrolisthes cinctipes]
MFQQGVVQIRPRRIKNSNREKMKADGLCDIWRCLLLVMIVSVKVCWGGVPVVPFGPKVLVVSLDGFGHQYLEQYPGPHLASLYAHGAFPENFINQFVTKTFPNHWSIVTGVYEEVHGVVGNTVYDGKLNITLHITDRALFSQNPSIIPIWTLNEQQGGHSGCIMWPGCNFSYNGTNVTHQVPFKPNSNFREKVDTAVMWMTHSHPQANLVMIYHDQPDQVGHAYGPNSPQVIKELKKLDDDLGYLYRKLEIFELRDVVDIIVLSDHGMSEVPEENIINLSSIVELSKIYTTGFSPVLNVWTQPGVSELEVFYPLMKASASHHYQVLVKDESKELETWHYKHNSRISNILLVADEGYVFQDFWDLIHHYQNKSYPNLTKTHGDHGYPVSSPNMEPIFVARGPSFRRGFPSPPFTNLDVYPLLCHILGLPAGPHNGSLEAVRSILAHPTSVSHIQPLFIALGCTVALVGIVGVIACVLTKRDRKQPISADTLINGYVYRKTMKRQTKQPLEDISEEECLLEAEAEDV